jgi:hypothetical protein
VHSGEKPRGVSHRPHSHCSSFSILAWFPVFRHTPAFTLPLSLSEDKATIHYGQPQPHDAIMHMQPTRTYIQSSRVLPGWEPYVCTIDKGLSSCNAHTVLMWSYPQEACGAPAQHGAELPRASKWLQSKLPITEVANRLLNSVI